MLSLEELPWEGPWRGTHLVLLERIWGDTSYWISWGICGTGKVHVILFHRVFVTLCASCDYLCGLHVREMGVDTEVGKWANKQ